jgi:hypothetical protein
VSDAEPTHGTPVIVGQSPVIATITGDELLNELKAISKSLSKLDDVPAQVKDHETRLRHQESLRCVTWAQLGGVLTLLLTVLTVAAAFLAVHGGG